jgi:hypothetical protein
VVLPEVWLASQEDGSMSKKRAGPEETVAKLRQVDVLTEQGQSVAEAIRMESRTAERQRQLAEAAKRAAEDQLAWTLWQSYFPDYLDFTDAEASWVEGNYHPDLRPLV